MKPLLISVGIAGLLLLPRTSTGQASCRVTVEAQVEVAPGKLSLADLLSPDTCKEVVRAAAAIDLGRAPLAGSIRVLAGDEVRAHLEGLILKMLLPEVFVPERISIRRAGPRASCADLGARLLASAEIVPSMPSAAHPIECGAGGRVAQQTPLRLTKAVWDPAHRSWDVSARCIRSADCVPFLLRVPGSGALAERALASAAASKGEPLALLEKPVVRPGETVTLLWDQDGIRLTVPAVCLDAGAAGQRVRARIGSGGRTLPAIVLRAGMLRTAS